MAAPISPKGKRPPLFPKVRPCDSIQCPSFSLGEFLLPPQARLRKRRSAPFSFWGESGEGTPFPQFVRCVLASLIFLFFFLERLHAPFPAPAARISSLFFPAQCLRRCRSPAPLPSRGANKGRTGATFCPALFLSSSSFWSPSPGGGEPRPFPAVFPLPGTIFLRRRAFFLFHLPGSIPLEMRSLPFFRIPRFSCQGAGLWAALFFFGIRTRSGLFLFCCAKKGFVSCFSFKICSPPMNLVSLACSFLPP